MIRLGILGVESSHTDLFIRLAEKMEGVKVSAICGETPELVEKFKKEHTQEFEFVSADKLADYADAILITVRNGAEHKKNVFECAKNNIAIWIDKPFSISCEDAKEIMDYFENNNIVFGAGTSIKYTHAVRGMKEYYKEINEKCMSAYMSFNIDINSEYGGLHFYSHHLIESAVEIFGTDAKSVFAKLSGTNLSVLLAYKDFNVILNYAVEQKPFHFGIFSKDSYVGFDMTYEDIHKAQELQFEEFIETVKTRKNIYNKDFFVTSVRISSAIEKSISEKREIFLEEV